MRRLAVFISGSGTNAENIIKHFDSNEHINVVSVLSDRAQAYGLQRARSHNVEAIAFSRHDFLHTNKVLEFLQNRNIDFIVLAGFLCYVPQNILSNYTERIVNIHPSLLPRHGGKGMYGERVHQAVIEGGDKESGITIHFVNENFDEGKVIFQAKCDVLPSDSAADVEKKVRALEIKHFPQVIEDIINKLK